MRTRRGIAHATFVFLAAAVLFIGLRSNMMLAIEQAQATRRQMDREQASLLLDSAERLVARRRAAGQEVAGLAIELSGFGQLAVRAEAGGLLLSVTRPDGQTCTRKL